MDNVVSGKLLIYQDIYTKIDGRGCKIQQRCSLLAP